MRMNAGYIIMGLRRSAHNSGNHLEHLRQKRMQYQAFMILSLPYAFARNITRAYVRVFISRVQYLDSRPRAHARYPRYHNSRADIRYCARVRAQCGAGEPKIHLVFTKNLWISFIFFPCDLSDSLNQKM